MLAEIGQTLEDTSKGRVARTLQLARAIAAAAPAAAGPAQPPASDDAAKLTIAALKDKLAACEQRLKV